MAKGAEMVIIWIEKFVPHGKQTRFVVKAEIWGQRHVDITWIGSKTLSQVAIQAKRVFGLLTISEVDCVRAIQAVKPVRTKGRQFLGGEIGVSAHSQQGSFSALNLVGQLHCRGTIFNSTILSVNRRLLAP